MEDKPKRPRGRPRKYDKKYVDEIKDTNSAITDRGAQNQINYAMTLVAIVDECTIETQRYFLGGVTGPETRNGVRKKCKSKDYVMEEMGRFPGDQIPALAEAIANNRTFDTWTQQEIVKFLKDIRLGRNQG